MPQKRNPDGLELVRAKSATISADVMSIKSAIRSLPTGYNRDFQETKGPFFRGCEAGLACVRIMDLTVERLVVNAEKLRSSFTPDIFATDRVLELVAGGMPFRDAYREVGRSLDALASLDPVAAITARKSTGSPGNLRLDVARAAADAHVAWIEKEEKLKRDKVARLVGRDVEFFRDPLR
jgi:argininosuccinate lyase